MPGIGASGRRKTEDQKRQERRQAARGLKAFESPAPHATSGRTQARSPSTVSKREVARGLKAYEGASLTASAGAELRNAADKYAAEVTSELLKEGIMRQMREHRDAGGPVPKMAHRPASSPSKSPMPLTPPKPRLKPPLKSKPRLK